MIPEIDLPAADPQPQAPDEPSAADAPPPAAWLVPVSQLSAHPGNVREDLELSAEFCASVAHAGVRVPLLVTPDGEGYRVIEGHRRLAAAVQAGLGAVPCALDPERRDDEAGQFLDMAVANGAAYRRNFTPLEEATALFAAREAGATRTRIRRATGRTAAQVTTALKAGSLDGAAREQLAGMSRTPTLDELSLLAEFAGDDDATAQVTDAIGRGFAVEYTAERIRRDRAEAAAHREVVAGLEAAGVTVTGELPAGAARLADLVHDGEPLTPEAHAACPGRGAYFTSWNKTDPVWYCAAPEAHGHADRYPAPPPAAPGAGGQAETLPDPPGGGADEGPGRRLVIEGNKAWDAAAEVRKRWLTSLLARRTAPREAAGFIAAQLLTVPQPLRAYLSHAPGSPLFTELTGRTGAQAADECATSTAGRLPLLMLAPVITAFEHEIAGDDIRRATWRLDRPAPCPRTEAGAYLAFLASVGYELAPIEQAVADGDPWTGDTPAAQPAPADSEDAVPPARDTRAGQEQAAA